MLTDKYKPDNFENFVGNKQNVISLHKWFDNWRVDDQKSKCCLISGTSGIGKTLSIDLLIKKYNLNPITISPEDKIENEYNINCIIPSIKIEKSILSKKNILIIHDIDSYDDYGFIKNILLCLKETKIPVITTCNNRYEQSLKPILSMCFDIKFQKPSVLEISKFLNPILKKEQIRISEIKLKNIIDDSNGDIRNILLSLQLNYIGKTNGVTSCKDKTISQTNIFELTKLFMSQNIDINEKYPLFWLNNDILPLMIHENYPLNNIKMKNEIEYLKNISDSISSLSDIDLIDTEIRTTASNWELLPYIAFNSIKSVSNCNAKSQIKFTEFFAKIAVINKNKKNAKPKDGSEDTEPKQSKKTKQHPKKAKEVKEPKQPKKTKESINQTDSKEIPPKRKYIKKVKLIIEE
jgi:replication factor C subunit 1